MVRGEALVPVVGGETKTVVFGTSLMKINKQSNLSCAVTAGGIKNDYQNLIISECALTLFVM